MSRSAQGVCHPIPFIMRDIQSPLFEQLHILLVCLLQQCATTRTNRRLSLGLPPPQLLPTVHCSGCSWHNLATLEPARQGNEEEEAPREKSDLRRGLHRSCSNCLGNDIFYDPKRKCRNQIVHHWGAFPVHCHLHHLNAHSVQPRTFQVSESKTLTVSFKCHLVDADDVSVGYCVLKGGPMKGCDRRRMSGPMGGLLTPRFFTL